MSTRGRQRFNNHHVLKKHKIKHTDSVHVWICKDGYECLNIERQLITTHYPLLNQKSNPKYKRNKIYVPEIKIIKPKIIVPKIAKPKIADLISDPEYIGRFKGLGNSEALAQCRNRSEYDLVNILIKDGLL